MPRFLSLLLAFVFPCVAINAQQAPSRSVPVTEKRPLAAGPKFFVDPFVGDDKAAGDLAKPWRTLRHAVGRLGAGDTLYLRAGVYYERVPVRAVGRDKQPITIASYPGEQAIIDGSISEFFTNPSDAWELVAGTKDEFRSRKAYPNLRSVMGLFGDSLIGVHTYHHAQDLRSDNEKLDFVDGKKEADVKPLYCGPGLWYDPATGHIHCRLAATHLAEGVNYQGVSDPRKLSLVVAPFRAVPLHVDGAKHLRFQDLIVRGGGYDTVIIDQSSDIEFDNVTVYCGTYGLRATGAQRLKLYRSGFHGSVPPWTFRTDTSLRSYDGTRGLRDITRFGTHALIVPECGREYSVFAYPINDDWEIAYCDFTDAHDGLYLGAINVRFHHNQVFDLQDDGVYLSPMYTRFGKRSAEMHVYQNYFGRSLTALAFGGPEKVNTDSVWIYRNVIDLRQPLRSGRPSSASPKEKAYSGHVMGDHGSPPWSKMKIYHNTCVIASGARAADMALTAGAKVDRPRAFFNNILLHLEKLPAFLAMDPEVGQSDGNLYWSPGVEAKKAAAFFGKYRASPLFEKSKKVYPGGFDSQSLLADPKLNLDKMAFTLVAGSPAINAGVMLPEDWPDPLRKADQGRPDIGALPVGVTLAAGRRAP